MLFRFLPRGRTALLYDLPQENRRSGWGGGGGKGMKFSFSKLHNGDAGAVLPPQCRSSYVTPPHVSHPAFIVAPRARSICLDPRGARGRMSRGMSPMRDHIALPLRYRYRYRYRARRASRRTLADALLAPRARNWSVFRNPGAPRRGVPGEDYPLRGGGGHRGDPSAREIKQINAAGAHAQ